MSMCAASVVSVREPERSPTVASIPMKTSVRHRYADNWREERVAVAARQRAMQPAISPPRPSLRPLRRRRPL